MTIPIAEGAAKHVAESVAKKTAKHAAKKKFNSKEVSARAKKTVSDTKDKAVDKGKTRAKSSAKGTKDKIAKSKFNPGSKHWQSPVSYSVRKQHNILIGMWFASTAVYAFAYYNNTSARAIDPSVPEITIQTFWKRFIAIQFVFFLLSIAVLFDTFARVVGLFSTLVFMGICFTNGVAILQGFKAITAGLHPPIGSKFQGDSGSFNYQGDSGDFNSSTQQAPPSNGIINT